MGRKQGPSLGNHLFWGALTGVAATWVFTKYKRGLPDPVEDRVDEATTMPVRTLTQPQQYGIAAGLGAAYGALAFYVPAVGQARSYLLGLAKWGFRATKVLALFGLVEDSGKNSSTGRLYSAASRGVSGAA